MKNFGIKVKMALAFSIILIVMLSVILLSNQNIGNFEEANNSNLETFEILRLLDISVESILEMESSQRAYTLTGSDEFLEPFAEAKIRFFETTEALIRQVSDEDYLLLLDQSLVEANKWIEIAEMKVEKRTAFNDGDLKFDQVLIDERKNLGKSNIDNFRNSVKEMILMGEANIEIQNTKSVDLMNITKTTLVISLVIVSVLAVVIGVLITISIAIPIRYLIKELEIMASGDLENDLPKKLTSRKDEIGKLSKALNQTKSDFKVLLSNVFGVVDEVKESSLSVATIASEANLSTSEISKSIEMVASSASDQVTATDIITNKVNDLSQIVNQSDQAIEEAFSSTEKATELSVNGQEIMKALYSKTDLNTQKTQEVSLAIDEVNSYASNAESIVSLIDNISDQTNLLALNASIEAARAGEAGRGFAVVANEIRGLAEETSKATNEINNLIHNIQERSNNSVRIIGEVLDIVDEQNTSIDHTSKIFNDTTDEVKNLVDHVKQVKQLAVEINSSKEDILLAVNDIARLTEETSASTEEISASAQQQLASIEELSSSAQKTEEIVEELREEMNQFKI